MNYDALNDAIATLDKLAGDFDNLSDTDARDDSLFIYKWKPPTWLFDGVIGSWFRPATRIEPPNVTAQRKKAIAVVDECVEISATLRWVATILKEVGTT